MKRKILVFLLCFVLLCIPMLEAQAEETGPWYYEIKNGGAYILGYYGDDSGHVEIPSELDGYTVTTIGNSAFMGRKMTSVTIPDTVTTLVDAAFGHCPNLVTVNLSKNVKTIDGGSFMDCDSLTGIWVDPQNQYYTSDEKGVLYTKDKTTLVQVPAALEGTYTIPEGVITIGNTAFHGCTGLTEITIANTVKDIYGYAFYDCSSLTRLAIPASVEIIGGNVFTGCDKLTGIDVAADNLYFSSDASGNLYNKDKTQILYVPSSFVGDYVVPEGTTEIGEDFFEHCSGLTSVTIPEGVTRIGHYAFAYCENLERVTLPESVSDIQPYTFEGCSKLSQVNVPEKVTEIHWGLFRGCESLTYLPIHDKVTIIDSFAFAECNGLTNIVIPASVEYVGHYAFRECKCLENIYFCGDAPEFVNRQNINGSFADTTATAYYHKGTEGWTAENKSKTGGSITWVELDHIVFDEGPDARCVVCGEAAEKNTTVDQPVIEDPDPPTEDPEQPIEQNPSKEENPKTADRISEIAGMLLILLVIGFVLMLKLQPKPTDA